CVNYGKYVIANRIVIGNVAQFTGTIGSPVSTPGANGDIDKDSICLVAGNATPAGVFPDPTYFFTPSSGQPLPSSSGVIYLSLGNFVYVAEANFDITDIGLLPWVPPL